jgi:hypothetical protein
LERSLDLLGRCSCFHIPHERSRDRRGKGRHDHAHEQDDEELYRGKAGLFGISPMTDRFPGHGWGARKVRSTLARGRWGRPAQPSAAVQAELYRFRRLGFVFRQIPAARKRQTEMK